MSNKQDGTKIQEMRIDRLFLIEEMVAIDARTPLLKGLSVEDRDQQDQIRIELMRLQQGIDEELAK